MISPPKRRHDHHVQHHAWARRTRQGKLLRWAAQCADERTPAQGGQASSIFEDASQPLQLPRGQRLERTAGGCGLRPVRQLVQGEAGQALDGQDVWSPRVRAGRHDTYGSILLRLRARWDRIPTGPRAFLTSYPIRYQVSGMIPFKIW